MRNLRLLAACLALALAVTMTWVDLSRAQCWAGGGGGPQGRAYQNQTSQDVGPGWGPGYANCPNYPGYQNCLRVLGNAPQGRRGPRMGGRFNQTNPPTNPSEITQ